MSTLKFEKIKMPSATLGKAGDYPLLFKPGSFEKGSVLSEEEQLFLNYGKVMHTLPYTTQGTYDHGEELKEFDAYVLENDFIKAVFIPSLGGRMWSLYDKENNRDLVVNNPIFRPCNLALRNAWFSGGVEWNCGVRGHHPLTCDKVYGAEYQAEDGTPILRLYAFERMRAITYQMDFFLPKNSRYLFARMRLVNASDKVTPIYWWSTIAVEQKDGARVIVPADETYVNHGSDPVYLSPSPIIDGVDTSYPTNHREATDHFYKIPESSRKFEAYIDKDGKGIIHASTRRQKGRKMFVWGTSQGGTNWQRFLTNKEGEKQPYLEIQAGLAYTQNESLPFPPNSAWEWLEAYCPIDIEPEKAHCDYKSARRNVEAWLDEALPEVELERMLADTKKYALQKVDYSYKGYPWGTLDNVLRKHIGAKQISPNLSFGELEEEQRVWLRFIQNGSLDEPSPEAVPASYMVQDEWFEMLKKTVRSADRYNWYAWYNLGLCYYARDEYDMALDIFNKSLELKPSTWAYHALACTAFSLNDRELGSAAMQKALTMNPGDILLAKEALRICSIYSCYSAMLAIYYSLPEINRKDALIQGYYAIALSYSGQYAQAKEILERDGGLVMNDLREGDDCITAAYIHACIEEAKAQGRVIPEEEIEVPTQLDYRMFHSKQI